MQHLKLIKKYEISTQQVHRMTTDQNRLSYTHSAIKYEYPQEHLLV